jgi:hypothetical protein
LRAILAFDADSAIDRRIVLLVESEFDIWEPGASFLRIPVERLRSVGNTGDRDVDQRIQALIAAHEQWATLSNRSEVDTLIARAETANDHVHGIANEIEDVPAATMEGLKVKALALAWCYSGDNEELEEFPDGHTTDYRLVRSIVRDLRLLNETSLSLAAIGDAA